MLLSKLALLVVPLLAIAAPTELESRGDNTPLGKQAGYLNELFEIKGDVIIGPGGWYDKDGFHPGEYTAPAGNAAGKREVKEEHEERLFGLILGLLIKGRASRIWGNGWAQWGGCVIRYV